MSSWNTGDALRYAVFYFSNGESFSNVFENMVGTQTLSIPNYNSTYVKIYIVSNWGYTVDVKINELETFGI